jgi:hypothetical protein
VDKRFQVFVSSTYTDLREERQAVISALLQLDAIPSGMELFPVADEDAWTLICKVIAECDYYLLLIGGKYGSVDGEGISFTEREYDFAVANGKRVMAFLHGDPDKIPAGKSEKQDDARARLERFRQKVETAKHVKYWTSAENLAGQVALNYSHFLKAYPAPGWIRADDAASPEAIAELNQLRKANFELAAQLQVAQANAPPGTEDLEQGDETYALDIESRFRVTGKAVNIGAVQTYEFTLEPTWDEILSTVGSRLLDESSEPDLRATLVSGLIEMYEWSLDEQAEAWLVKGGHKAQDWVMRDFSNGTISDDTFGTILIQLVALGLIAKSTRARSVKDRQTYWTLTPYGQARVIQLKAIRRKPKKK